MSDSSSDDDAPLAVRAQKLKEPVVEVAPKPASQPVEKKLVPVAKPAPKPEKPAPALAPGHAKVHQPKPKPPVAAQPKAIANGKRRVIDSDSEDSDSEVPLAQRAKAPQARKPKLNHKPSPAARPAVKSEPKGKEKVKPKASVKVVKRKPDKGPEMAPAKRKRVVVSSSERKRKLPSDDKDVKWTTLEHGGVLFPPEYEPHGVKMLYDGREIDLTPAQEEVRSWPCLLGGSFAIGATVG